MSFQAMLDDFTRVLSRQDCDATLATLFLQQGLRRIQRDCRLPSMERSLIILPTGAMTFFSCPTDLLQPIDLVYTGVSGRPKALEKLSYRQLVQIEPTVSPVAYARLQTQYWITGAAGAGDTLQFFYYGNFSAFTDAADSNELSLSSPDLGVYAALSYAGEHFEHPLTDRWEARYQSIKAEVQGMGRDLDAEGGHALVQPLYAWDD